MSNNGDFFAVGRKQWAKACEAGLNPAVAFLVLARGTGRDQKNTSWSARAVENYTGMSWRRAKVFVEELCRHGLAKQIKGGKKPSYELDVPSDANELIWLPNEIVTGAVDESPPLARLRQTQDIEPLQLFIELYREQDLVGDGGIPRSLIFEHYERHELLELGQYTVFGFDRPSEQSACFAGPLAKFKGRKRGEGAAWDHLTTLIELRLIERVVYLAEGTDADAELIHALSGDGYAERVADAALMVRDGLPEAFSYRAEQHDFVLPVIRHMSKAAVVGLYRMRYRAKTSLTSAWYGQHVESCRHFAELYSNLAEGRLRQTA